MIVSSCEDKNQINLETKLINLLDSDDISGIDGFDTNGDAELDFETGLETQGNYRVLSDTLFYEEGYKIRFGRRITNSNRTVEFEIGSDTAIGTVTYNINGVLNVKAFDTTDNVLIDTMSFSKDFLSTFLSIKGAISRASCSPSTVSFSMNLFFAALKVKPLPK